MARNPAKGPEAPRSRLTTLLGSPRLDTLLGGPLPGRAASLWAAFGGLAQALAWPKAGLWPLTWLGPLMLWRAIHGQKKRAALKLGWIYGAVLSAVSVSWLAEVMSGYGGLGPFGGTMVLLALVAYLALFQGVFAAFAATWTTAEPKLDARLIVAPLWAAVLWTGLDWLKNVLLTGFNWTPLAGSLAAVPALIGAADLVGVYGLGLIVALSSFLLAKTLDVRREPKAAAASLVLAALIILAQALYGHAAATRFEAAYENAAERRIASVLQPSIPQDRKWDPSFREETLGRLTGLINRASASDPAPWLILWPETSAPFIHGVDREDTAWLDARLKEAAAKKLAMLVGVAVIDYDERGYRKLKNRAWLLGAGGSLGGYDKTHLVPFGEYVPLAEKLPFLSWPFIQGLIGQAGNYSPGLRRDNLSLDGIDFGVLICFESIFPYQARERAEKGARFLVVTTNDGWFGASAAPAQHLLQASMRAVETRLPLLRAANNGLSAHISPSGRVLARTSHDEVTAVSWSLGLVDPPSGPTLFVRGGWLLAPACGLMVVVRLVMALGSLAPRRKRRVWWD